MMKLIDIEKDNNSISEIYLSSDRNEQFAISVDIRHGKSGFRVSRYIYNQKNDIYDWDESYLFYENFSDFLKEVDENNYKNGRLNF